MPISRVAGKEYIGLIYKTCVAFFHIKRVLDIGAGCGTFSDLGRTESEEWTGIEIWGPYAQTYKLEEKYDQLIIGDVRYIDFSLLGRFDWAFIGDILEHYR